MIIRKTRPAGCARLPASALLIAVLAGVFDSARCEAMDARLAAALTSIARRSDADPMPFNA